MFAHGLAIVINVGVDCLSLCLVYRKKDIQKYISETSDRVEGEVKTLVISISRVEKSRTIHVTKVVCFFTNLLQNLFCGLSTSSTEGR